MEVQNKSAYIRRIFNWQQGNVPCVIEDIRNFLPSIQAQCTLLLWDCIDLQVQTVVFGVVTSCSLVGLNMRCRRTRCLNIQV
jgi:hypothetical protein